jgi:hypothetical protein
MTHTYAVLEVSPATFNEICTKLRAAGYESQFHETRSGVVVTIDMHGLALQVAEAEPEPSAITLEQQRELDAWVAGNEPTAADAAEAIRQGNWTWQEYQEHLQARAKLADEPTPHASAANRKKLRAGKPAL